MKCTGCGEDWTPTAAQITHKIYRCLACRKPRLDRTRQKNKPETISRRDARYRADPEWHIKYAARLETKKYIRKGLLVRQPCSECGATRSDAHHTDYSNPLAIVWICRSCHRRKHNAPNPNYSPSHAIEVRRKWARKASQQRWRDPEERRKKLLRRQAQKAVAQGKISKEPCLHCGDLNVHIHHKSYDHAFDIIFLCPPCHRAEHDAHKRSN